VADIPNLIFILCSVFSGKRPLSRALKNGTGSAPAGVSGKYKCGVLLQLWTEKIS
jgi:hypothetical protein